MNWGLVYGAAMIASILLFPLIQQSLADDHYVIIILSLFSAWLIVSAPDRLWHGAARAGHKADGTENIGLMLVASLCFVAALVMWDIFALQKMRYASGGILLWGLAICVLRIRGFKALLLMGCCLALVPPPSALETAFSMWLAGLETKIFVLLGQLFGLPIRQFGPALLYDGTVITINQDCSGSLLVVPCLLGAFSAVAFAVSKRDALKPLIFALPLAMALNLVRLAVTIAAYLTTGENLADNVHEWLGTAILAVAWLLPVLAFVGYPSIRFNLPRVRPLAMPLAICFVLTVTAGNIASTFTDRSIGQLVIDLPPYKAGWIGQALSIDEKEARIIQADFIARRHYSRSMETEGFIITAIYHRNALKSAEHSSARCFKAMGWRVRELSKNSVAGRLSETLLEVQNHAGRQYVLELVYPPKTELGGLMRVQVVWRADQASLPNGFYKQLLPELSLMTASTI